MLMYLSMCCTGFAVFMLLLYPIGVPVVFFLLLHFHRNELWKREVTEEKDKATGKPIEKWVPHDQSVWISLGVLYGAYEPEYW